MIDMKMSGEVDYTENDNLGKFEHNHHFGNERDSFNCIDFVLEVEFPLEPDLLHHHSIDIITTY